MEILVNLAHAQTNFPAATLMEKTLTTGLLIIAGGYM
jgi:hypothetical protein